MSETSRFRPSNHFMALGAAAFVLVPTIALCQGVQGNSSRPTISPAIAVDTDPPPRGDGVLPTPAGGTGAGAGPGNTGSVAAATARAADAAAAAASGGIAPKLTPAVSALPPVNAEAYVQKMGGVYIAAGIMQQKTARLAELDRQLFTANARQNPAGVEEARASIRAVLSADERERLAKYLKSNPLTDGGADIAMPSFTDASSASVPSMTAGAAASLAVVPVAPGAAGSGGVTGPVPAASVNAIAPPTQGVGATGAMVAPVVSGQSAIVAPAGPQSALGPATVGTTQSNVPAPPPMRPALAVGDGGITPVRSEGVVTPGELRLDPAPPSNPIGAAGGAGGGGEGPGAAGARSTPIGSTTVAPRVDMDSGGSGGAGSIRNGVGASPGSSTGTGTGSGSAITSTGRTGSPIGTPVAGSGTASTGATAVAGAAGLATPIPNGASAAGGRISQAGGSAIIVPPAAATGVNQSLVISNGTDGGSGAGAARPVPGSDGGGPAGGRDPSGFTVLNASPSHPGGTLNSATGAGTSTMGTGTSSSGGAGR